MRKIWYLKQEKGQKTKTAKVFLYEKNGRTEGRMDLSAFCNCERKEDKALQLHIKDAFGKDVGKINLKEGDILYEGFFQGKGKLREELAEKLRDLKGEAALSVTLGTERYLSEGWKDEKPVSENADRVRGAEVEEREGEEKGQKGTGKTGKRKGNRKAEKKGEKKKKGETERAGEEKKKEETEGAGEEKKKEEAERTGIEGETERTKEKKKKEKIESAGRKGEDREESGMEETEDRTGDLEAEELLEEESEEKRIVQLSVLEDEMLFRAYVHNSFLLHGYYNYGHVMIDESGKEPRLGVPGNYYEREQMVAEMFGFPVFEAAREGEQITNGTFGYFYTRG